MSRAHGPYALVAFPLAVEMEFTYAIPENQRGLVRLGSRVLAPLRKKMECGFVTAFTEKLSFDPRKLLEIERPLDAEPIITQEQLDLAVFIADYYRCSMGEALRAVYPFQPTLSPKLERVLDFVPGHGSVEQILEAIPERAKSMRRVVEVLGAHGQPLTTTDLAREAGVSPASVSALVKKGILEPTRRRVHRRPDTLEAFEQSKRIELNRHQVEVLERVGGAMVKGEAGCFLLHGVTGSGKTEVYMRAIARCLEQGKTALVLVPEIGLTPQAAARYRGRFGDAIAILHSALGAGERFDEYHAVRAGERSVVVGTRSAVFAPLANLGLIIVDEEHDGSYKQDTTPRYNGRDVAVWRAHQLGAVCVLGSATPSVDSALNANRRKYAYLSLPERAVPHGLPEVRLIDMRGRSGPEATLSAELEQALRETLAQEKQTILLLNRRGYASAVLCRQCGHILECPNCSISMVYHRDGQSLLCHHCDHRTPIPAKCPACEEEWLRFKGMGTEQLEEILRDRIPEARIERMDVDSTRKKGAHADIQHRFWSREIDVLVGTQMVAKGLDMPGVTLVGVLQADSALTIPDFRAAERTFCLLTQVAGRAGRGAEPGRVLIQSHCPGHYSVRTALRHDYKAFYSQEIGYRRAVGFPPFSRLVRLEVNSEDPALGYKVALEATEIIRFLASGERAGPHRVIGPSEAGIWKIKNRYRWQILLLAPTHRAIRDVLNQEAIRRILTKKVKDVRVIVDVDPLNLL